MLHGQVKMKNKNEQHNATSNIYISKIEQTVKVILKKTNKRII